MPFSALHSGTNPICKSTHHGRQSTRWWAPLCLALLLANAAPAVTVSGRVFFDRNGDAMPDDNEPGLRKVAVSDGRQVVLTERNGEFQIEVAPGAAVFVTLPKGYRGAKTFYSILPAVSRGPQKVDFPMMKWPESARGNVRFAQITDLHITKADTVESFIEDIAEINAMQPKVDFAVATGDLVNQGKHASEFENYVAGISHFKIPIFSVVGNHDIKGPVGASSNYVHFLGPENYSANIGDCHFVMINSVEFGDEQKLWVEKDLKAAPRGTTPIFLMHYLPSQEELEYFTSLGGKAVLSGHWHGNRVHEHHGNLDLNSPPLRFGGIDRSPRGFRVVEVKGGKATSELRFGGFKQYAAAVAPSGTCTPRSGKLQIVVNAYDSSCEVQGVECEIGGRRVSLRQASAWTWIGECSAPAGPGSHLMLATVRDCSGRTWTAQSTFSVRNPSDSAARGLTLAWVGPTGGLIAISSARVGASCVAVGVNDDGDLKRCGVSAFDRNGRRLWHFPTDSAIKNSIAISEGRVFATSVAGCLYALDERSGKLLWKSGLKRHEARWETSATTVSDGVVYVGGRSYVAAFDAAGGGRLWDAHNAASDWWPSCYTIPTVAHGRLLLTSHDSAYTLDAATGKLLWKTPGKFNGCVVRADVIYAMKDDHLAAMTLNDGKVLWSSKKPVGDTASVPAIAGDKLVVGTAAGEVCAFSIDDGSLLWTYATGPSLSSLQPYRRGGSDVNSSPAISEDAVYIGSTDGELHVLSLSMGTKLASFRIGVPIASSPVIDGHMLYVGAYDGNLYAFDLGRGHAAAAGKTAQVVPAR